MGTFLLLRWPAYYRLSAPGTLSLTNAVPPSYYHSCPYCCGNSQSARSALCPSSPCHCDYHRYPVLCHAGLAWHIHHFFALSPKGKRNHNLLYTRRGRFLLITRKDVENLPAAMFL